MSRTKDHEDFLSQATLFLTRHLDQHSSAETTLELEVAALIIMVDVGRRGQLTHWIDVLHIVERYARKAAGDCTACSAALQQLATLHAERINAS